MSSHSPDQSPVRTLADRGVPGSTAAGTSGRGPIDPDNRTGFEQLREMIQQSVDALRHRRRAFWVVFIGTAAVLGLAIAVQTPLYESTSLMLVKFGRELVYTPEIGQERSIISQDKAAVINSELAIMRSQPVLEGVVRSIGVAVLYPSLEEAFDEARAQRTDEAEESGAEKLLIAEAAERLRLSLATQALPEADVLQVSYQHPDPLVAARTVNELVERFTDAHLSAFAEPEVVQFLEGRVAAYDERLAETEQALREFQTEHPAFALENPQAVLVQQREEIRARLAEVDNQMATIRLRHLQEDASVAQARSQLLMLEVEAAQLEGRLQKEKQGQIAVVKRFIAQRKLEVEGELRALEERREQLTETLRDIDIEIAQMPRLASAHRRLARERDGDEQQYNTYRKRLRDARLSGEMDRERLASINVIQPASPAPRPVWPPSRPMSAVIAVVLALMAAVLVVVLLDRMGPTGVAWLDESEDRAATG